MTAQTQTSQAPENKPTDKEMNFRALEARLNQERAARLEAEKKIQELSKAAVHEEEEPDNEPYVDHRKFNKTLKNFGQNTQTEIQKAMEQAKLAAKEELKQELWLEQNKDFEQVMQHAGKLYEKDQELANSILKMPDNFERAKLVYRNIKALGIDKPPPKEPTIQEKVDANKRSPYYQPSGVGTAPYQSAGNYSAQGQKDAYAKMQELKARLRI